VLTLGGGPSATTLEVGIYQALRFDYDPARATVLALLQLLLLRVLRAARRAICPGGAELAVAQAHPAAL